MIRSGSSFVCVSTSPKCNRCLGSELCNLHNANKSRVIRRTSLTVCRCTLFSSFPILINFKPFRCRVVSRPPMYSSTLYPGLRDLPFTLTSTPMSQPPELYPLHSNTRFPIWHICGPDLFGSSSSLNSSLDDLFVDGVTTPHTLDFGAIQFFFF
jgi:hypothetical protein